MNRTTIRARRLLSTAVAAALLLAAHTAAAAASAPDYAALAKDVRILGKVLEEATVPDAQASPHARGRARIDGLYLAGQGMLFQVRIGGAHFVHGFFEAPLPPIPPIPPIPPVPPTGATGSTGAEAAMDAEDVLIDSDEIGMVVDEAMSGVMDSFDGFGGDPGLDKAAREELRALREAQGKAARDYAERQRAWVMSMHDAKAASQAERDKRRAELERSRAQLESAQNQLRARAGSLRAEQRQRWQARVQQAEGALLDALCSYAGSTRRIGAGEHVSLVIEDAGGEGEGQRRVWVVRKADLESCASGSQSADFLRKKALSYLM